MKIMKYLLVALSLALSVPVSAQLCTAVLTWTPPTTNTDGTPLTNLAGYKIYWGTSATGTLPNVQSINTPASVTHTVTGLAANTWYFAITSVNSAATESAQSNRGSKITTNCSTPNPPTNLTVQASNPTAWVIQQSDDNFVMLPVGTSVVGTVCNEKKKVDDGVQGVMYLIPKASVTFPPGSAVQARAMYALCG
jgi:hypothetical protein